MEISRKFDAIVLAGGDGTPLDPTQPVKGLVEICGKPMVQWVLDALSKASSINRIVVVLPKKSSLVQWPSGVIVVEHDGRLLENCEKGFEALDGANPIMWVTADIPSVTPEAIDSIAEQTLVRKANLSYPLIHEEAVMRQFPGSTRTYLKLREGRFTGGNIITCTREVAHKIRPIVSDLFAARKEPLKVARLIGPQIASKFALGVLTVPDAEKRISKLFGIRLAGILTHYAEIGVDVDKQADIRSVEKMLQGRQ
jgi:GTP:adenosylcobinamide-phosphate guanylyltransferase